VKDPKNYFPFAAGSASSLPGQTQGTFESLREAVMTSHAVHARNWSPRMDGILPRPGTVEAQSRIPSVSSDMVVGSLHLGEGKEDGEGKEERSAESSSSPYYNEVDDKHRQLLIDFALCRDDILAIEEQLKTKYDTMFVLFSRTYEQPLEMRPMLTDDTNAMILNAYGLSSFKYAKSKYVEDYMSKRKVTVGAASKQWKKHFVFLMACLSLRRDHEQCPTFEQFMSGLRIITTNYMGASPSHGMAFDRIVSIHNCSIDDGNSQSSIRSIHDGNSQSSISAVSSLTSQSGGQGKNDELQKLLQQAKLSEEREQQKREKAEKELQQAKLSEEREQQKREKAEKELQELQKELQKREQELQKELQKREKAEKELQRMLDKRSSETSVSLWYRSRARENLSNHLFFPPSQATKGNSLENMTLPAQRGADDGPAQPTDQVMGQTTGQPSPRTSPAQPTDQVMGKTTDQPSPRTSPAQPTDQPMDKPYDEDEVSIQTDTETMSQTLPSVTRLRGGGGAKKQAAAASLMIEDKARAAKASLLIQDNVPSVDKKRREVYQQPYDEDEDDEDEDDEDEVSIQTDTENMSQTLPSVTRLRGGGGAKKQAAAASLMIEDKARAAKASLLIQDNVPSVDKKRRGVFQQNSVRMTDYEISPALIIDSSGIKRSIKVLAFGFTPIIPGLTSMKLKAIPVQKRDYYRLTSLLNSFQDSDGMAVLALSKTPLENGTGTHLVSFSAASARR
jgi:hypothetical protein